MELDRAARSSRASQQWLASLSQGSTPLPDASRAQNEAMRPAPPVHIRPRGPPSTISLRPNPKQNELPETDPSMSEAALGTHKWKVAAYKSALQRKLPLVDRCSFIQHGLCHVCTATATTNTNPALVVNVCPYFDFGHSICVVHFERLARTLVSTMLEDSHSAVAPCPICLHACTCVVCTRVVSKQVEQYDAYMASASSSQAEAADVPPATPSVSLLQQAAALPSVRVMNTSNIAPTTSANSWRTQLLASTSSDEQDKPVEPPSPRPTSAAKAARLDDRQDTDVPKASAKQVARKPVLATKQAGPLPSPQSSHENDDLDATARQSRRRPSSDPMLEADSKESYRPDDVRTNDVDAGASRKSAAKPSSKTNGIAKASAKESHVVHSEPSRQPPRAHGHAPDDRAEAKGTEDDVAAPCAVSIQHADPADIVAGAKAAVVAPVQSFKETSSQRKDVKSSSVQPKAAAKATMTSAEAATDPFLADRRIPAATPVAEPKARTPSVLPYRSIAPKLASKAVTDEPSVVAQPKPDARPAKSSAKTVVSVSDLLQSTASPGSQGTFTLLLPPPPTPSAKDTGSGVAQDSQPKPSIQPTPVVVNDQVQAKPAKGDSTSSSQPRRVVKSKASSAEKATKPAVNAPKSPTHKTVAAPSDAIAPTTHSDAQSSPTKPNGDAIAVTKEALDRIAMPSNSATTAADTSNAAEDTAVAAQSKEGKASTSAREKKTKSTRPKEPTQVKAKPDAKHTKAPATDVAAKAPKATIDATTAVASTKALTKPTAEPAAMLSKTKNSDDSTNSKTLAATATNVDKTAEVPANDSTKAFKQHSSSTSVDGSAGEMPPSASPHKQDHSAKPPREKIDSIDASKKTPESSADPKQSKRSAKAAQSAKSVSIKSSRGALPPSTMIYKRPSSKTATSSIVQDANDDAVVADDYSAGKTGAKGGQDAPAPKLDAPRVAASDDDAPTAQPPLKRLKRGADQSTQSTSALSGPKQPHAKVPGGKRQPVVAPTNVRERKPRAAAPPPGALINQHKNDDLVVAPPTKTTSRPAKSTVATHAESVVDLNDVLQPFFGQPKDSNSLKRSIGSTTKGDKDADTSKRIRRRGTAAAAASSPVDDDDNSDKKDNDDVELVKPPAAAAGGRAKKKASNAPLNPDKAPNKTKQKPAAVEEPATPEPAIIDQEVDTNLDYCSVCKVDGDLVCCDVCPRSFHLSCLNMREDELPDDNWQCHECLGNLDVVYVQKVCQDLSKSRNKASAMHSILLGIYDHPFAKPFLNPVEDVEYYDDVVKQRMDLTTVATRLKMNQYARDAGSVAPSFVSDVNLIWANCRLFNDEKSGLARAAKSLQADFKRMVDAATSPSRR